MSTHTLMSLTPRISPRAARRIAAACGTGVLLVGVTACGSSGNGGNGNAGGAEGGNFGNTNGGQNNAQGRFPGANGKVVAVTGSTAQVQNQQDGQVAVTWNGSTTFTKQVSATLADVKVGSCVVVGSAETGSAGSGSTSAPTAITATTVRISAKSSDGTCTGGFGGGNGRPQFNGSGQPPAGAPSGAPSGVPSGAPSGAPQVRGFGGAFGEVTAVSATGFTVKSTLPQLNRNGSASGSSTPSTQTTNVTVTVNASTKYTKNGTAAASDVKNGVCVRAQGTTDSTGAVTAKTVDISPATNGECETGFARTTRGGPGGGYGGPGGGYGGGPVTNQES